MHLLSLASHTPNINRGVWSSLASHTPNRNRGPTLHIRRSCASVRILANLSEVLITHMGVALNSMIQLVVSVCACMIYKLHPPLYFLYIIPFVQLLCGELTRPPISIGGVACETSPVVLWTKAPVKMFCLLGWPHQGSIYLTSGFSSSLETKNTPGTR